MQKVVELLLRFLVLLFPGLDVLLEPEAFLGNSFSKIALVVEVFLLHVLRAFAQVLVFNRILVLLGVNVHLATCSCQLLPVQAKRRLVLSDLTRLSDMVPVLSDLSQQHISFDF